MIIANKDLIRFMSKVNFFEKDKCWEWVGGKNEHGYGIFYFNKKFIKAHRFSLMINNGLSHDSYLGGHVLHKCDNPPCVNPDHLYIGTQKQNMNDKIKRNRDHNLKKTHCKNGHPYNKENTIITTRKNGYVGRSCRVCKKVNALTYYYKSNTEENKQIRNEKAKQYYYDNLEVMRRKSLDRYYNKKKNGY